MTNHQGSLPLVLLALAYCKKTRSLVAHRESQFDRRLYACHHLRGLRRHYLTPLLLIDVRELLLRFRRRILIRVVFLCQLVVCFLDFRLCCVFLDPKQFCNSYLEYRKGLCWVSRSQPTNVASCSAYPTAAVSAGCVASLPNRK